MPRENRRVKLTKLLLTDSFLQLLAQKPLSRITVKSICEHADLNRSTYYQYYKDPYDQLEKLETSIIADMASCIDDSPQKYRTQNTALRTAIQNILDYMYSNKDMLRILLSNNTDISLQKDIQTIFAETLIPKYFNPATNKTALQEFIFISNGSFGIIYYWLMIDTQIPAEELAMQIACYVEKFLH